MCVFLPILCVLCLQAHVCMHVCAYVWSLPCCVCATCAHVCSGSCRPTQARVWGVAWCQCTRAWARAYAGMAAGLARDCVQWCDGTHNPCRISEGRGLASPTRLPTGPPCLPAQGHPGTIPTHMEPGGSWAVPAMVEGWEPWGPRMAAEQMSPQRQPQPAPVGLVCGLCRPHTSPWTDTAINPARMEGG